MKNPFLNSSFFRFFSYPLLFIFCIFFGESKNLVFSKSLVKNNEMGLSKARTMKDMEERTLSYYRRLKEEKTRKFNRKKSALEYKKDRRKREDELEEIRKAYIEEKKKKELGYGKKRKIQEKKYQENFQKKEQAFENLRSQFVLKNKWVKKVKRLNLKSLEDKEIFSDL